ncbi:hypothetical protein ACS0TY_033700 [Phlomoides rotata]
MGRFDVLREEDESMVEGDIASGSNTKNLEAVRTGFEWKNSTDSVAEGDGVQKLKYVQKLADSLNELYEEEMIGCNTDIGSGLKSKVQGVPGATFERYFPVVFSCTADADKELAATTVNTEATDLRPFSGSTAGWKKRTIISATAKHKSAQSEVDTVTAQNEDVAAFSAMVKVQQLFLADKGLNMSAAAGNEGLLPQPTHPQMILISWNVRGLRVSVTLERLSKLLRKHKGGMLGLCEMKLTLEEVDSFLKRNFDGWEAIHNFALSTGGRVLILWNAGTTRRRFLWMMIYGRNTVVLRRDLWDTLLSLGCNFIDPWLLTGDVNCILNRDKKEGGVELPDNAFIDMLKSKLGRVMVNNNWRELGWNICTDFLTPGVESDHACSLTTIFGESGGGKKPFRFYNMWTKHDRFDQIVADGWDRHVFGTRQFVLCKKLKGLKRELKVLNKRAFGHICERTEAADTRLGVLQVKVLEGNGTLADKTKIEEVKDRVKWLKKVEKAYLAQLAKNNYIFRQDTNSKYFHALVKKNKKRNHITHPMTEEGSTESEGEVAGRLVDYYTSLLGADSPSLGVVEDSVTANLGQDLAADLSEIKLLLLLRFWTGSSGLLLSGFWPDFLPYVVGVLVEPHTFFCEKLHLYFWDSMFWVCGYGYCWGSGLRTHVAASDGLRWIMQADYSG